MRVLVVDDMQERHDGFVVIFAGHDVHSAFTYTQALDALRNKGPWDLVCLDHDLADAPGVQADYIEGAGMYADTQRLYLTGLDLAFWLRDNPAFCPPRVVIHSWNPDGAKNMEAVLRQVPTIEKLHREQFRAPVLR